MNKVGELDYFGMSMDDLECACTFSDEALGAGYKAALQYACDFREPSNLTSDAWKVFNRFKKRIDDTRNGFDPYAQ